MNDPLPEDVREDRAYLYLALAIDDIQSALPVADTPLLVEELLIANLRSADRYLRDQVRPTVGWFS